MLGMLTGRRGGKQRDRLRGEAHVATVRSCSVLGGRVEGWKGGFRRAALTGPPTASLKPGPLRRCDLRVNTARVYSPTSLGLEVRLAQAQAHRRAIQFSSHCCRYLRCTYKDASSSCSDRITVQDFQPVIIPAIRNRGKLVFLLQYYYPDSP